MKSSFSLFSLCWLAAMTGPLIHAADDKRAANTVILDEVGVRNLHIQTVPVEEQTFERTVFAIGRVEEIPANRSVLSSRVAGRVLELNAFVGDNVKAGDVLAVVESRHPGNPPPRIPLKASRSGLVIESHVRLGEPVGPDKELMDISDRSEFWAVARIPEQEASAVTNGTPARIRIPAIGGKPIEATLFRYGVSADRHSGTVDGIFVLKNTGGLLRPGMRAEFSIVTAKRSNVLAVPKEAIQGDATKRQVFVKDFDIPNAFVRSPVELGEQNDRFVEIVRGVFPGDEVVTRGSYPLSFAGGGSGPSLKEALDAAHGHEHNEDGSEMTGDQKAADDGHEGHDHGPEEGVSGPLNLYLQIYAGVMTLIAIVLAQLLWNRRKKATT